MILGRALVVVLRLALAADGLEQARAAFDGGDYERAEALALAEAGSPRAGEALHLAALARFRAGRPAEALEALDAAALAPDPPERASWEFNRGACLYELGRHAEAEAAFLEAAAAGGPVAAVALANAGFAALDGGSPERARDLARRAGAVSTGAVAALVADLEAEIAARSSGADVADDLAEPPPAQAAGVERQDHPATPARGLARRGAGGWGSMRFESGFDDNVLQSGLDSPREPRPGTATHVGSAVATTAAAAAYLWLPRERVAAEIAYAFDELAFFARSAEDYSVQQHGVAFQLELSVRDRLRLGASLLGHVALTGLSDVRRLQAGAGARSWIAFDEGERGTTRLTLEWTGKNALAAEFDYLTGDRADALFEQELQLRGLSLAAVYRFRVERIGTMIEPAFLPPILALCSAGPGACPRRYVIPLAYLSNTVALSAHGVLGGRLDLAAAAGVEWRTYLADSHLDVFQPDGRVIVADPRRRRDERLFTSLFAGWRLSRTLEVGARYDLVVSRSNVERSIQPGDPCAPPDFRCHALDYDDKNYTKNQFTAEAILGW